MIKLEDITQHGIVGAGGAGFPTHIKLDSSPDILIMNAAECEPLLHKDMEMLRNYSDQILNGFELAMELTSAQKGLIGIKGKNRDVVDLLRAKINGKIELFEIGDFYPAGDEISLIYELTGRIVQPGELPISVGCLVQNVETLYNIASKKPVVEKFVSVAGAVERPATVQLPVGIQYAEVLSKFQITTPNYVIRSGGLMMGQLEKDVGNVISKRTGALIILPVDHFCVTMYQRYATEHQTDLLAKASCDQCNFCTEFCPRYLLGHPVRPETAMRNRMFIREGEEFVDLGSAFCCECNLCTMYACPESLDPKGATVIEKGILRKQNKVWRGLPVKAHPMLEYRKVPTKKLKQRLDVMGFKDEGPLTNIEFRPKQVKIPLDQHIGAPAIPAVREGEAVKKYDLIGKLNGKISACVHASINGRITEVTPKYIVIEAT
jgi:Na+-translocating ferredoxin:NAD+ oxidoreductase RnfC subunit